MRAVAHAADLVADDPVGELADEPADGDEQAVDAAAHGVGDGLHQQRFDDGERKVLVSE